jgi:superfamily II DNA/RNA helicase
MMFAYICKVKTNARLWEIAMAIGRTRSATCMMIKQANRMLKEQGFYQEINDIIKEINDEKELEGLGILAQNNYEI